MAGIIPTLCYPLFWSLHTFPPGFCSLLNGSHPNSASNDWLLPGIVKLLFTQLAPSIAQLSLRALCLPHLSISVVI